MSPESRRLVQPSVCVNRWFGVNVKRAACRAPIGGLLPGDASIDLGTFETQRRFSRVRARKLFQAFICRPVLVGHQC